MAERDALPCPGCHTPLPTEATGCQICMRSRTKQEIMRGYAKLREEKSRKRRRPFQILAAVLILGLGGKLLMVYHDKLTGAAGLVSAAVGRWTDDIRNPSNYAAQSPAVPSAATDAPAAAGSPVPPEAALRTMLNPPDSPPVNSPPPAAPARPAEPSGPPPLAKNAWRVSGTVYDLATLEPVPGAEITFLRNDKEPATATTDEKGVYEIDLAKAAGWTVNMTAPRLRGGSNGPMYRGLLVDVDPPYRVRDADERRATLEQITDGDFTPAQVGWKLSSSKVRLDLIAVPQR